MINTYLNRFERFLKRVVDETDIPAKRMRDALNYVLFPGGKRIRPLLVYLTGQILEVELTTLDAIAAAVEITHCYSLVHDDLPAMDDDDWRRGKPSCHKAFDEATAILVGDGMQALAIEVLLRYLSHCKTTIPLIEIISSLLKASGMSGMISGQSLDLSELPHASVSLKRLETIHSLKTGLLFSACINMVLAAAPEPVARKNDERLKHFAACMGIAFQIQDDYLDRYAAKELLGKQRSSDEANQKITFATYFSKQELEQEIRQHYRQAISELECFGPKAQALIDLSKQLAQRSA